MIAVLLSALLAGTPGAGAAAGPAPVVPAGVEKPGAAPRIVTVKSGPLRLGAYLWLPPGRGPFPAVLFNHGSGGPTGGPATGSGPDSPAGGGARAVPPTGDSREREAMTVGPVFARHGYAFLFLCRRGSGLSFGQGRESGDVMEREYAAQGQEGRNRAQVRLLEHDDLDDAQAGLACLRALPEVDPARVAVVGHSFGGSLAILQGERDKTLRAVVDFGGGARSWADSPELRVLLLEAAGRVEAPVLLIHAANDYSVAPGQAMALAMERVKKPHLLRLYPAVGTTRPEGHNFIYSSVATWEGDVFAFLDENLRPGAR